MTSAQHDIEMKTLKKKSFNEENNNEKIYSHVSSLMKRKLFVDINIEGLLMVKLKLIILINPMSEGGE